MLLSCSASLSYIQSSEYEVFKFQRAKKAAYLMFLTVSLNGAIWVSIHLNLSDCVNFNMIINFKTSIVADSKHVCVNTVRNKFINVSCIYTSACDSLDIVFDIKLTQFLTTFLYKGTYVNNMIVVSKPIVSQWSWLSIKSINRLGLNGILSLSHFILKLL